MPELKPCPICSSLSVGLCPGEDEITHEIYNQAFCTSCGVSGPRVFADEISAIAAWNSLPRALTWTTEPPKVVGRFWWRDDRHQNEADILNVTQTTLEWFQHNRLCPHEQFAGPIPEPKE